MGIGLGTFLGGLAGSYGENELRLQKEERDAEHEQNQQKFSILRNLAFGENTDPETRKYALKEMSVLHAALNKGKGKKASPDIYSGLGDFLSAGESATSAQPQPAGAVGPASMETQAPDLFSTSGAHLASPGSMAAGAAQGQSPRMFEDPLNRLRGELGVRGQAAAEAEEAERQRRLAIIRGSGKSPEEIQDAELAFGVGFPMQSRRQAEPELALVKLSDGSWQHVPKGQIPPGAIPESAANRPEYRPGSPGQKYQDDIAHAIGNLGMSETEAQSYAKQQEVGRTAAAKELQQSRIALNQSLLGVRAATLEEKRSGKKMTPQQAQSIINRAQAYKNNLLKAWQLDRGGATPEEVASASEQFQEMMELEIEQQGVTLQELQAILQEAAGRTAQPSGQQDPLDQIFSQR